MSVTCLTIQGAMREYWTGKPEAIPALGAEHPSRRYSTWAERRISALPVSSSPGGWERAEAVDSVVDMLRKSGERPARFTVLENFFARSGFAECRKKLFFGHFCGLLRIILITRRSFLRYVKICCTLKCFARERLCTICFAKEGSRCNSNRSSYMSYWAV